MKTFMFRFVLILVGLFLLTATQVVQAAGTALSGTSWVLSSLNGQLPLPGTTVTLQFDADGVASGSDGCNRYTTGYTVSGARLSFDAPGAMTMMACPEPAMLQATAYMETLASVTRYEVRGNQLTLLNGSRVVATFVSALEELGGTSWQVVGYNNGREAVVSLLDGSEISVAFDSNNQVTGNGGCNDFFSLFQTSENTISIGDVGATRRFCSVPAGIMEQEAEFFAALESAATFSVDGNILEMRDGTDALAVRMERQLTIAIPEPGPAVPTGRVTAPAGINVRSGPGTNFPVLGTAPYATEGEIIGRSVDGRWWVVAAPSAPGGSGWVSADFVAARDVADVPMIAAPPPPVFVPAPTPLPTPTPRPQPTATPSAQLSFRATQTTINQGSCTTLEWSVENVQAVWVFPQGRPYQQYPRVGQGSEQVCPPTTTTYEMRVLLRDGTVTTQRVTVNVTPGAPQNPLNGTAWQVTGYYTGRGAVVSPIVGTNLTTRFEATQLSGQGGCNEFAGGYSVSGSNISIGALASGMAMCSDIPGTMEQEADFLAALQSSSTFRFDGNRLEMRRADGTVTVFFTRLQ